MEGQVIEVILSITPLLAKWSTVNVKIAREFHWKENTIDIY